jgi:hypothetical protein
VTGHTLRAKVAGLLGASIWLELAVIAGDAETGSRTAALALGLGSELGLPFVSQARAEFAQEKAALAGARVDDPQASTLTTRFFLSHYDAVTLPREDSHF